MYSFRFTEELKRSFSCALPTCYTQIPLFFTSCISVNTFIIIMNQFWYIIMDWDCSLHCFTLYCRFYGFWQMPGVTFQSLQYHRENSFITLKICTQHIHPPFPLHEILSSIILFIVFIVLQNVISCNNNTLQIVFFHQKIYI